MHRAAHVGVSVTIIEAVHAKRFLSLSLICLLPVSLALAQAGASDDIHIASQEFTPEQAGTIHVESTMVPVNVVVRDSHGKPVSGLTKEDFQLFDQGKPQTISQFSVETAASPLPTIAPAVITSPSPPVPPSPPLPRYVGMYFDDNNMKPEDVTFVRRAAEGFVKKNLQPYDRVAIFTSSTTDTLNFTQDQNAIIAGLEKLVSHYRSVETGAMPCPKMDAFQAMQIAQFEDTHNDATDMAVAQTMQCRPDLSLQDAMRLVQTQAATTLSLANQYARMSLGVLGDAIRYMARMPGKKMIVMCSSGFFARSEAVQKDQDKMIDAALHAGIVINTLDAKSLAADWLGGDPADGPPIIVSTASAGVNGAVFALADEFATQERDVRNDPLSMLAEATGGTFIHNSNDLDGGLVVIAAAPDVSYILGFSPDVTKDDGSYHALKVRLANNKSGYTLSARPGYFVPTKLHAMQVERFETLNKEVLSHEVLTGVPASVNAQVALAANGMPTLKVAVHVDVRGFPFKKEDKLRVDRLIYITALFDTQGNYLAGVETVMDMRMHDATFAELVKSGATAQLSLQAPPGNYKLREVVQEVVGGRFSTINQDVVIQ